jgi:two-component system sensor kinase FixL
LGEVEVFKCEYRAKHKNGSWLVMEGYATDYGDEIIGEHGVLVNSRDITDRKIVENQLRNFTARLEQSNRELEDFAYVASHDLQEPLRKVQAFGDRLNKKYADALGDEGRDYVRRMRDAADRMQILINDLLTFSRVATKTQPFVPIDLNVVADEVVADLEIKIEETGATIEISRLPTIEADALQMRQLLQNLIGNALKFKRENVAPLVRIYAFEDADEIHKTQTFVPQVKFAVEDNGIGFDEKYLDRIFTVFQRLHGRTEYEGSGVGLAVCRKITERHGGSITARSADGAGATFVISLPVKQTNGGIFDE